MKHKTKLSIAQITISLLLFFSFFQVERIFTTFTLSKTISITVLLNTFMFLYLIFNYKLVINHFHRFIDNLKENLFYTFLGVVFIAILFSLNHFFLKAGIPLIEKEILFAYPFFFPFIFFAFTSALSFCCCTALKLFTDRLNLGEQERYIILLSGVLFGAITAICELPLPFDQILRNFALYASISVVAAYLYNQTSTIFAMIFSFSFVLLIYNILLIFI